MRFIQGTWYESLRQKFKDARRNEKQNAQVIAMKEKYGGAHSRPRSVDSSTITELPKAKKNRVSQKLVSRMKIGLY
jgi:hypothetical protein